jgi:hypothetical protein
MQRYEIHFNFILNVLLGNELFQNITLILILFINSLFMLLNFTPKKFFNVYLQKKIDRENCYSGN